MGTPFLSRQPVTVLKDNQGVLGANMKLLLFAVALWLPKGMPKVGARIFYTFPGGKVLWNALYEKMLNFKKRGTCFLLLTEEISQVKHDPSHTVLLAKFLPSTVSYES